MPINKNDIVTIYVAFANIPGGKKRPVLVIENDKNTLTFLKITTKYKNKSQNIKDNYYPIINWKSCGLRHPSYIDTGMAAQVKKSNLDSISIIGELNIDDIAGLNNFQKNIKKK